MEKWTDSDVFKYPGENPGFPSRITALGNAIALAVFGSVVLATAGPPALIALMNGNFGAFVTLTSTGTVIIEDTNLPADIAALQAPLYAGMNLTLL